MSSVLYSAGLNYQAGNPLRSEIMRLNRDIEQLRKLLDVAVNEMGIYRKYITTILDNSEKDSDKALVDKMVAELSSVDSERNTILPPVVQESAPKPLNNGSNGTGRYGLAGSRGF